ncbi:MAG: LPS export ABC transporter periplasmic protein LptC [Porphyromonadaceae bacterium]|nr:LPS export ABC transporter periplasmic protein LptC [Porphyromonadaceae bacterium]
MDDPQSTHAGRDRQISLPSKPLVGSPWGLLSFTHLWPALLLVAATCFTLALSSCGKKKVDTEQLGINLDSSYRIRTLDVDMLVSDTSGLVKYRLRSPLWLVYDQPEKKEWIFPEGIHLEDYDTLKASEIFVLADHAIYKTTDDEWILTGNVRIHGPEGRKLYTPKLYWDRSNRKLYSNDTTYFVTQGRELHGDRFDALDDLSQYSIYNNRGVVEYEDKEDSPSPARMDTTRRDTLATRPDHRGL